MTAETVTGRGKLHFFFLYSVAVEAPVAHAA
jgi:hypothetical protein